MFLYNCSLMSSCGVWLWSVWALSLGEKAQCIFLYSSGFTSDLKEHFFSVFFQSSFFLPNSYPSLSYFYSLCKYSEFFNWGAELKSYLHKSSIVFCYSNPRPKHAEVIAILPYTQWTASVYMSLVYFATVFCI